MKKEEKSDISDVIGGTLNILGLKIDIGKLLSSAEEDIHSGLEELREKLKQAGGKEVLSDDEWRHGGVGISGHLRTSGILGEREYHIGTTGAATREKVKDRGAQPPEAVEPAVDVFSEPKEVVVVAEVPGVELADLELKVEDNVLSFSTKATSLRRYHKKIELDSSVDAGSLQATCRNGVLEVHLGRKATEEGQRHGH